MFDLIAGTIERPLRERAPGSKVVSTTLHVVVLALVVGIPLLRATNTLPDVQTIMAFAAAPSAPPPPPPLPSPAPARSAEPRPVAQVEPKPGLLTVPLETPTEVKTEATTETTSTGAGVEGGVRGGIEGGAVGGVLGGVVGGIISSGPPPPPAPVVPVRVGGQISTPALLHRVEPVYPNIAAAAHVVGTVILEAVVGTDGCVESAKVLRSRPLLDNAAIAALKQWRYTPLVLNGTPTPFVLTVTFSFSTR